MDKDQVLKAGEIAKQVREFAKTLIKKDVSLLEIADKIEDKIRELGAEPGFPVNLSINNVAAHYTPSHDDESKAHGLLKIDIGAHYNGYIADSAFTINIDEDPKLQNYVDGAKEGLEAAIQLFNPGVKLYELGEVIAQKIINRGLRPITNLGGHELKQYNLHAGPFIPNYKEKMHNQVGDKAPDFVLKDQHKKEFRQN